MDTGVVPSAPPVPPPHDGEAADQEYGEYAEDGAEGVVYEGEEGEGGYEGEGATGEGRAWVAAPAHHARTRAAVLNSTYCRGGLVGCILFLVVQSGGKHSPLLCLRPSVRGSETESEDFS